MAYITDSDEDKGPFELDEDLNELHPEVKEMLLQKASASLEKAGIKKEDERHSDLAQLELLLNLAKLKESTSDNARIRSLRRADVERAYGADAPAAVAAMGLQQRDLPKGSNKTQMLNFLLKKGAIEQKSKEKAADRKYKQDYLKLLAGQSVEKAKSKKTKEAHSGVNKRIDNNLNAIKDERKAILSIHTVRPTKNYAEELLKLDKFRRKFEDIRLDKDPESKSTRTKVLEEFISNNIK